MPEEPIPFVSRGGLKLAAALDAFAISPAGLVCADLGCNVGGFTDCLLQRGAAKVHSVDTAYGQLAWKLRNDGRVAVHERTNALHFEPASLPGFGRCGLVVIDLGWSRQQHAVPAALRWLAMEGTARIITLIKPHYESTWKEAGKDGRKGVLTDDDSQRICNETLAAMSSMGVDVLGCVTSPIRGGGGRGREGNVEYLAMLRRS
jgi:23S rRNA (cytidine1920-2'-O)/16S rRNA (cytidine1409-2'-O)-methyltransferase